MLRVTLLGNLWLSLVLNGACFGWCAPQYSNGSRYHVSTYSGVRIYIPLMWFKALWCCVLRPFVQIHSTRSEWTSICGPRYAVSCTPDSVPHYESSVGQLPQTSYHALQTPYAFFGLGRTNNYIENLFVGSTKTQKHHFINMEGVIPNSKVVISPPVGDQYPSDWKKELYLRPGEWIPLVSLTVVIATLVLAVIWLVLRLHEKVSLPPR